MKALLIPTGHFEVDEVRNGAWRRLSSGSRQVRSKSR